MDSSVPSSKRMQSAWELCQRTRHPHTLEAENLVLGLLYGDGLGAARAAATISEGADTAHVQAARLFAALQIKLRREPDSLREVTPAWLTLLLTSLPTRWAAALQVRGQHAGNAPATSAETISTRLGHTRGRRRPDLLLSLADMEIAGRA